MDAHQPCAAEEPATTLLLKNALFCEDNLAGAILSMFSHERYRDGVAIPMGRDRGGLTQSCILHILFSQNFR